MDINKSIQLAVKYFQSGNLREAEPLFKEILIYQPENAEIIYLLGLINLQFRKYDLAIEYIYKTLGINKNYAEAFVTLAIAFMLKGCREEASKNILKSIEINLQNQAQKSDILTLVTGTGRSGTGYMANLLTSAGLPCEHEGFIGINPHADNLLNNKKIRESSWLAAPLLSLPYFTETKIIHAVRNPLHTVQSFMRIEFFIEQTLDIEKNLYYLFVINFLPKIHALPYEKAPFYFFIEWTKMILTYENDERYIRHKIEDDPVPLIKLLKGNIINLFSDRKYNTIWKSEQPERLTTDDIPTEYKTEFLEISERIGYKLI